MTDDDSNELYDEPNRDNNYEYTDPDEMHRVRRLQQIHDSRERFESIRLKARELVDLGQLPAGRTRYYAAQLALDYVRQLEPILTRADSEILSREVTVTDVDGEVPGHSVTVADLLDANGTIKSTRQYRERNPDTNAMETKTEVTELTLDESAATRLVRLCDDFLEEVMPSGLSETADGEIGLDIEDIE
jgi:hypothetical protein